MAKSKRKQRRNRGKQKGSLGNTQNPSGTLVSLLGGTQSKSGVEVSDSTAMRVSTVYACVRVIAEDLAKLKPKIWRTRPDGGRELANDHPLSGLLSRPNRHMTMMSYLLAQGSALGFRGNAIAVKLYDRGRLSGLWPVHPGNVTIYEAENGMLFYGISRKSHLEQTMLSDTPIMVPDYDIMHVRGLTFDGIVGLSPLAQLREAIGIAIGGEQLSAKMMANGAQPSGVLRHPQQISEAAANRLRNSWDARHGGTSNAGKTVILEEGMEWQPMGMTSVDAQFLEQRRLTIEEIARGFRVPLHMIGMLDRMTFNNVEQISRSYYDQTLMPMLEAFEEEFSRAFDLPEDVYVEFDVKRLLRADFKTRQEGHKTMFAGGAFSPNEWRMSEGMNPTEGGDVYARPLNTAFVDDAGNTVSVTPASAGQQGESDANPDAE